MNKKPKIKSTVAMTIGRYLLIPIIIVSVVLFILTMMPDHQEIVRFESETAVRESVAYECIQDSIRMIRRDSHIESIISISYVYTDVDTDTFNSTSTKIVYNNGSGEVTRYFRKSHQSLPGKEKASVYEIGEQQYNAGLRVLLLKPFVSDWKDKDLREHSMDEYAINIILNDAKEVN